MYELYATCPEELTEILAAEIREIGGQDIRQDYRVVYFSGDSDLNYRAHLQLRTASRICRIIKDIPAGSPNIVYDKAKRIRWPELFDVTQPITITINASSRDTRMEPHLIGSKIREAITNSFEHYAGKAPNLSARDAKIQIIGFYHRKRLMLSVDTAYKSLHKRGYRVEGHPAPLKETLAAAMLRVMGYDGTQDFCDPMCGSGSIAIEAAQISMNKSPLIHRKKGEFGFEHLKDFDNNVWRKVQDAVRQAQHPPRASIFARDLSSEYLKIARETALAARVEKHIEFAEQDFFKSKKPSPSGILIANLPYGLRLEEDLTPEYLRRIGDTLKQQYVGWRCGLLLPAAAPYKEVGLKAQKKYDFKNGKVAVKLLVFDIYD